MSAKVTIYDIAKEAEVSPATVSRMINQPEIVTSKTRDRILDAFRKFEIQPEDLATRKKRSGYQGTDSEVRSSKAILVSIPTWKNTFYDEILDGLESVFADHHYHMIVTREIPTRGTVNAFLKYASDLNISGVVLMYSIAEDLLRQLHASYPIIQCSEYNPLYPSVPYVSVDDFTVSKEAVAHLIARGCRKIAFFSSSYEYRYVQDRYRAYKITLLSKGLSVIPELVVQDNGNSYDQILQSAYQLFRQSEMPDAVFAVSDMHAHATINAAIRSGLRVPEDLMVFGFDNTSYSRISNPTISTVEQPCQELGKQSARLLLDIIDNPGKKYDSILLPTKLILRESTKDRTQ